VNPEQWTRLARAEECSVGHGKFVTVGDLELAVFHLADPDRFVVARNSCPHAGGNLAAGDVAAGAVTCPWHHWTFDLDTGVCTLSETVRLRRNECKVVDGYVCADLENFLK
jgi:nitrite reductase (NADH) small subunit